MAKERHPSSERFHQILKELGELHDLKQADYGTTSDPFANVRASERFGIPAWVGSIIRGNDKMARLQTFVRKGELCNESVEDSLRDLAVYAIIALVLYEEATRERAEGGAPGASGARIERRRRRARRRQGERVGR